MGFLGLKAGMSRSVGRGWVVGERGVGLTGSTSEAEGREEMREGWESENGYVLGVRVEKRNVHQCLILAVDGQQAGDGIRPLVPALHVRHVCPPSSGWRRRGAVGDGRGR